MYFGKNLRFLRLKYGLKQEDIGKLVGKDYSTIQRWETNIHEPSFGNVAIISSYFNVTIDNLVFKDLEKEDPDTVFDKNSPFKPLENALYGVMSAGYTKVKDLPKSLYDELNDISNDCMDRYLAVIFEEMQ